MLEQGDLLLLIRQGEGEKAVTLCRDELEREPGNSDNYLVLGRTLVACGDKRGAIRAYRDGLLFGNNSKIREELNRLGWRSVPVIQDLAREHWLNRMFGKLFAILRLR